jgi:hypothetical protein
MAEIWMSLGMGIVVGVGAGWAAAWRMARKLERVGVGLAEWDHTDWRELDEQAARARFLQGDRA